MIPVGIRIPGAIVIIIIIPVDVRIVGIKIIIKIRPALAVSYFHTQVAFFFIVIIVAVVAVRFTAIIVFFLFIVYTYIFSLGTFGRKINIIGGLTRFISCCATNKNEGKRKQE